MKNRGQNSTTVTTEYYAAYFTYSQSHCKKKKKQKPIRNQLPISTTRGAGTAAQGKMKYQTSGRE